MPTLPAGPPIGSRRIKFVNLMTGLHAGLYSMTNGKIGGKMAGTSIVILHHRGRKTGEMRKTPLTLIETADQMAIIASKGGSEGDPAWWLNIRDAGSAEIELGEKRLSVTPRVAEGAERDRLWARAVETYSDYAVYQSRTDREIPVIVLEPAGAASPA